MARTILPIVGGIVGSFFGAPQLGFAIGSLIGNAVDPQRIKGPRIGDANVQTSQEGSPRPIVFGTAAVMGNLIDRGPLEKVITEERQGKGGGPVVETESLFMTFAIRICEGEIDGISRIWEDEKLVYDVTPGSKIPADSNRYASGFTLYLGDEEQLPDPDLEAIHGVGNTPAYRGTAYIVFKEKNLTERRGSIPQFRFEVNGCIKRVPVGPTLPEPIPTRPEDAFQLTSWNTQFFGDYSGVIPEGAQFGGWSLNDILIGSLPDMQYELYLNGELVLTTPVFPQGASQPRIYYSIPAQPGDIIRCVRTLPGQHVGSLFAYGFGP